MENKMITIYETRNKYARRAYIVVWSIVTLAMYVLAIPAYVIAGAIDGIVEGVERLITRMKELPETLISAWRLW